MEQKRTVDSLAEKLQAITLDKLAAEKRIEALESIVENQRLRIEELEFELDYMQQQKPLPMMDIDEEKMHWSPAHNLFSPIVGATSQNCFISPVVRSNRRCDVSSSPISRNQHVDFYGENQHPANRSVLDSAKKARQARTLFHDAIFRRIYMSPNMFVSQDTPPNHVTTPKSFRWSIEHRSFMNPAKIDESKAAEQSSTLFDTADNSRIQQVVTDFFKQSHFPSPASH